MMSTLNVANWRHSTLTGLLVLLVASLTTSGCKRDEPEPDPDAPEIRSFTVSPAEIIVGDAATLAWETAHATGVSIVDADGNAVDLGDAAAAEGSVEIQPTAGTTYTLTATGAEGTDPAEATISITVNEPDAPLIVAFSADPDGVLTGDATTLSWEVAATETVTIVDADGNDVALDDATSAYGSVTVTPDASTTYTLTATGRGGEVTADTDVTVYPRAQILSATVDPNTAVLPGTEVTLSWETEGALSVEVRVDGDVLHSTDSDLDGSFSVTVDMRTEFEVVASGYLDSVDTGTVEVPVIPLIDGFEADNTIVRSGDEVTFDWTTRGAETLTLTGPGGFEYEVPADDVTEGGTSVTVTTGGIFSLTAVSGALDDVATIDVEITDAPRIRELTLSADEITAGQEVTIAWQVDGATSLSLEITDLGELDLTGYDVANDSIDVMLPVAGGYTVTLTATNDDGSHEATAPVEAVAVPIIDVFAGLPLRVGAGETVELSWETQAAETIQLEKDGADLGVAPETTTGSTTDTVDADASYVLRAFNRLGYEVVADTVTVVVGAPEIGQFAASADHFAPEESVTLSWQSVGGATLTVTLGTDEVCTTTDAAEIADGTCVVDAPADLGAHTYTLEVTNGAGTDTETVDIFVSDGPILVSLDAAPGLITLGDTFALSWDVTDDASGTSPDLGLEDDLGNVYDLSAFDANEDTADIAPADLGMRTFTFTASTDGTTDAVETFYVEVVAAPVVVAFGGDPESIDTEGNTIAPESLLSWETESAVALAIYELDASQAPIEPAVFTASNQAEVDEGGYTVYPAATTRYRLVATNAAGTEATAEVRIIVDGAEIVFFDANPPEIIAGESVTLEWETVRADSVSLDPGDPTVTEITSNFVDISATGTPLNLSESPSSNRHETVQFPAGFTFPYYGQDRTEIQVVVHGFVSFHMTGTFFTWINRQVPSYNSGNTPVIAPFWDRLQEKSGQTPVYYEFGSDAEGQYMRIQWDDLQFGHTGASPSSVSLQLVLRETGAFEFHYGTMNSPGEWHEGSTATIGFEDDAGSEGYLMSHNTVVPGGLENRAWRFDFSVPITGTKDVSPSETTTYTLTAHSTQGSDEADLTVIVHPSAEILMADHAPAEVQNVDDFDITWRVSNASAVAVLDEDGTVLCTEVVDPEEVVSGSCTISALPVGTYEFTVEATSILSHHSVSEVVEVTVDPHLEILSFDASAQFLQVNDPVTVSWTSTGAESVALRIGGASNVLPGDADPDAGDFTTQRTETADFVLTITAADGRTRSETIRVYVNAATLTDLAASETLVEPGESVTLTWNATNAEKVEISPELRHGMFEDISMTGTELSLTSTTGHALLEFPEGFTFPYYGEARDALRVFARGYFSFNTPYTTASTLKTELPTASVRSPVLAPFWDTLRRSSDGQLLWELKTGPEGDYLVLQWTDWEFSLTARNPASLTFQAILHEDGSFEYRYGSMTSDDQDWADGDDAVIGFENDHGTRGYTLHFKEPFDGGLSNRGWRFNTHTPYGEVEGGSVELVPEQTTTYHVCATGNGWTECESVTVEVLPATLDSVTVSDTVVEAGETVTIGWDAMAASVTVEPSISVTEFVGGFQDISATGTQLPITGWTTDSEIQFPGDFTFPYFGENRTEMKVFPQGYISFNMDSPRTYTNTTLPNSSTRSPMLALFWDDLDFKGDSGIFWERIQDAEGDRLIVQWDKMDRWGSSTSIDVTFQLVLYADGRFEYNYGTMQSATHEPQANGSQATIGFEDDAGVEGHLVSFNTEYPGGLTNRSWRFRVFDFSDGTDSVDVEIFETTTFTVCAIGGGHTECESVTVYVAAPGLFMVSEFMADSTEGVDGQWIELHNTTDTDFDLEGFVLEVDSAQHVIASSVPVPAGGYVVLGRSGDPLLNGGYVPDYVYGADLTLSATGSAIGLHFGSTQIDGVVYDDQDWNIQAGYSVSLNPLYLTGDADDNLDPLAWCVPTETYGDAGQFGTPGEANGDAGCGVVGVSYTSSPGVAIPDNDPAGVSDLITVTDDCDVMSVSVDVEITHSWIGDLYVDLVAPSGTTVRLHDRTGGSASDIVGNYPATLTPHESLSILAGEDALGDWALWLSDNAGGDIGTLDAWGINLQVACD